MIRHVVLIRFYDATVEEERHKTLQLLAELGMASPEVREWSIGRQLKTQESKKLSDIAEVATFDNLEAVNRFQKHPAHGRLVEYLQWRADWDVVDYEYDSSK